MEQSSTFDLGSTLLSIAVLIGFLGFVLLIIRSIEIPIRIYLDKRKKNQDSANNSNQDSDKGF